MVWPFFFFNPVKTWRHIVISNTNSYLPSCRLHLCLFFYLTIIQAPSNRRQVVSNAYLWQYGLRTYDFLVCLVSDCDYLHESPLTWSPNGGRWSQIVWSDSLGECLFVTERLLHTYAWTQQSYFASLTQCCCCFGYDLPLSFLGPHTYLYSMVIWFLGHSVLWYSMSIAGLLLKPLGVVGFWQFIGIWCVVLCVS